MTPEKYATEYMPLLHGWCEPEKALDMIAAVRSDQPRVCVEIGVFAGRSLFAVATALKELGVGHVYGIEPWAPQPCKQGLPDEDANAQWWESLDHNHIQDLFYDHRRALEVEDYCSVFKKTSEEALEDIKSLGAIDFLHIDGNHSEEVSCLDVDNYLPLMRPGGQVWFDDVDWESTKQAQLKLHDKCEVVRVVQSYGIFRVKS